MKSCEEIAWMTVADDRLPVIVHTPSAAPAWVMLIVVGGPQYRVGSHRQFVLAARAFAAQGVACVRFDYRGMGDATGAPRDFLAVEEDISAAVAFTRARFPSSRVCLYGLCDGASAIALWLRRASCDAVVLINPWVFQEHTAAETRLRSYYLRRLVSPEFWRKLLSFQLNVRESSRSLGTTLRELGGGDDAGSYVAGMLEGLRAFSGAGYLVLSGDDLTAAEFQALCRKDEQWGSLFASDNWANATYQDADHTFSEREVFDQSHAAMLTWLGDLS